MHLGTKKTGSCGSESETIFSLGLWVRMDGDGYKSEQSSCIFIVDWMSCAIHPPSFPASMFFSPELLTRRDSGFGLLWYVDCRSFYFLLNRFRQVGCYPGL
jgi:hypothetical protein